MCFLQLLPVWCDRIYRNRSNQTTFSNFFHCFFLLLQISASGNWSRDPAEASQHIPPAQTAAASTCLPFLYLLRCCGGINTEKWNMRFCVTLRHHITARWPHICGKKFPQTSICTSPKAQSGGKTGVFSISAILETCWESDKGIYRSRHRTKKLTRAPPKRLTSTSCWQKLRPTNDCAKRMWHHSLGREYSENNWFFRAHQTRSCLRPVGGKTDIILQKMSRFRVWGHT